MPKWKSDLDILDENHIPDLERLTLEQEKLGHQTSEAEKLAYSKYKEQKMLDGAIFHIKCAEYFKDRNAPRSQLHKALAALYKLEGYSLSLEQAQSLDKELLSPQECSVHHSSDYFVLGIQ